MAILSTPKKINNQFSITMFTKFTRSSLPKGKAFIVLGGIIFDYLLIFKVLDAEKVRNVPIW